MIKLAVYRLDSGLITRRIISQESVALDQCGEDESIFINCPDDATHIINGEPFNNTPPISVEELIASIVYAVQSHLDSIARTHNYDGILSLASYAFSTDPIFSAEATSGIAWRDACWRYCYTQLAAVSNGERPMPTPEEAVSELPHMVWPV